MKNKILLILLVLLLALSVGIMGCDGGAPTEQEEEEEEEEEEEFPPPGPVDYEIGISQILIHPLLDDAREGFKDALTEAIENEGATVTYDEQEAAGEPSIAATITESFVDEDVNLICAISTPSVKAAALAVNGTDIPVVFNSVTNPVIIAGVCDSWDVPGGQVTGVSDIARVEPNLELIRDILEANSLTFEKLGVIYNPDDDHSAYQVKTLLTEAIELLNLNISVEESLAYNTTEVSTAAEALVGRVDAILVPEIGTVQSAFEDVVAVAEENDIPLFCPNVNTIERGAIGCWGLDYYVVGYLSGQMAAEILLEGANPATMPVQTTPADLLYLNQGAAERMGVTIPDNLLDIADQIIE
jgi:putative ABC transport system substrate-binding protein